MKNFVQPGLALTVPAPAAIASGVGVKIGAIFGVAAGAALTGADLVLDVTGVFDLPKAAGAVALGALVYWDDAAKVITLTTAGNTKVGVAVAAAGAGDATARVRLSAAF